MALYDYLCARCGPFEVSRTMGTAGPRENCPHCGRPAGRKYGPPAVTSPRSALNRAREDAERSAHEPRVVSGAPLRAGLPRP